MVETHQIGLSNWRIYYYIEAREDSEGNSGSIRGLLALLDLSLPSWPLLRHSGCGTSEVAPDPLSLKSTRWRVVGMLLFRSPNTAVLLHLSGSDWPSAGWLWTHHRGRGCWLASLGLVPKLRAGWGRGASPIQMWRLFWRNGQWSCSPHFHLGIGPTRSIESEQ